MRVSNEEVQMFIREIQGRRTVKNMNINEDTIMKSIFTHGEGLDDLFTDIEQVTGIQINISPKSIIDNNYTVEETLTLMRDSANSIKRDEYVRR